MGGAQQSGLLLQGRGRSLGVRRRWKCMPASSGASTVRWRAAPALPIGVAGITCRPIEPLPRSSLLFCVASLPCLTRSACGPVQTATASRKRRARCRFALHQGHPGHSVSTLAADGLFLVTVRADNNRIARATGATIVHRPEEIRDSDIGTRAGLFDVRKIGDEFFTFIVDCEVISPHCFRSRKRRQVHQVRRQRRHDLQGGHPICTSPARIVVPSQPCEPVRRLWKCCEAPWRRPAHALLSAEQPTGLFHSWFHQRRLTSIATRQPFSATGLCSLRVCCRNLNELFRGRRIPRRAASCSGARARTPSTRWSATCRCGRQHSVQIGFAST